MHDRDREGPVIAADAQDGDRAVGRVLDPCPRGSSAGEAPASRRVIHRVARGDDLVPLGAQDGQQAPGIAAASRGLERAGSRLG